MATDSSINPVVNKALYANVFLLLLIFAAHHFFYIGSFWYKSGIFNIQDVGNLSIWIGVAGLFLFTTTEYRRHLLNPISALIAAYLVIAVVSIFVAQAYYGQSLFDGLVAMRRQFYYLTFFLFFAILKDTARIKRFLDILVVLSFVLIGLAVLNYFGPTIFSHKWALGHGQRAGIVRAFIPGMWIINLSMFWTLAKWMESDDKGEKRKALAATLMLLAAIFFRQTRMRVLSASTVTAGILVVRRKWRAIALLVVIASASFAVLEIKTKENVIANAFTSAVTDVTRKTGTWPARARQLKDDFREFKKYPIMGSGTMAVRVPSALGGTRFQRSMFRVSDKADFGYSSWLKSYGLVGLVWLALFAFVQLRMVLHVLRRSSGPDKMIAVFALSHLGHEAISFLTLNHLMLPEGIMMDMLTAAVIARLYYKHSGASEKAAEGARLEETSLDAAAASI